MAGGRPFMSCAKGRPSYLRPGLRGEATRSLANTRERVGDSFVFFKISHRQNDANLGFAARHLLISLGS